MGVYLRPGQTFEEVVRRDAEILKRAGLTHQQVGDALEKVLQSYNWHQVGGIPGVKFKVNDTLSVEGRAYRGFDICPFDNTLKASRDYYVSGIPNGNKAEHSSDAPTLVTEMMPNLIRKLHFFEGDVLYGIKPEWAIQVYELVQREGANVWVPKKQTVYRTGSFTGNPREDFVGSSQIIKGADRQIQLTSKAVLYLKGQRGIIVAEEPFEVTSEVKIDGLPLFTFGGKVMRGQTFVNKEDIIIG